MTTKKWPLRAVISIEAPERSDLRILIEEFEADCVRRAAPECCQRIDRAALAQPDAVFVVARTEWGEAIGFGALSLESEYGEIKHVYTRPDRRGGGIAKRLIAFLEAIAVLRDCSVVTVRTGFDQHETVGFYRSAGYHVRDEVNSTSAVLLAKSL